jgi:ribosome-binding protein aMBF1 (putative translation factor)
MDSTAGTPGRSSKTMTDPIKDTRSVEQRLELASLRIRVQRAFGECLRTLREEHALSIGELAQRARVPESAISKAESGRSDAKVSLIYAVAQGLGVPPARVIEHLADRMTARPIPPSPTCCDRLD